MMFKTFAIRLFERVAWTAIQAGAAVAAVELTNVAPVWAVPIAAGLAWVKGLAARHVGDPEDPSTIPWRFGGQ